MTLKSMLFMILLLSTLAGCSSGSSDPPPSVTPPPVNDNGDGNGSVDSHWDQMIWDQDNWS